MQLDGKTLVVTGGASGIGRALSQRFAGAGAQVVVADLNADGAQVLAREIDGLAVVCDVSVESDVRRLVAETERHFGPVDLFCSNAGVYPQEPGHAASASNVDWKRCWDIHVMAHVYAARAVLPGMLARGGGYLLQMVSAAGLLSQIGNAAYSTTKHAAIGFAESLAISHGDQGIRVSVVCPQFVATPMLGYTGKDLDHRSPEMLTPGEVADSVLAGVADERFLILPHAIVAKYRQRKAADYDRWLAGMRRLRGDNTPDSFLNSGTVT